MVQILKVNYNQCGQRLPKVSKCDAGHDKIYQSSDKLSYMNYNYKIRKTGSGSYWVKNIYYSTPPKVK